MKDTFPEREFQLKTLLELNERLAKVYNRLDFYPALVDKLRPYIAFDDAVVIIYSVDQKTYNRVWTVSLDSRKEPRFYERIVNQSNPIEGLFAEILNSNDIAVFKLEDWADKYAGYPGIQLHKDEGLTHTIKLSLKKAGKAYGALLFHFTEENWQEEIHEALFRNIANQMSITIHNILAHEQLMEEKQFKERLLDIAESVSRIKDRQSLFEEIYKNVKPFFQFDMATLLTINADGKSFKVAYTDDTSGSFEPLFSNPIILEDSPFKELFDREKKSFPVILEEMRDKYPSYEGLITAKKIGYTTVWFAKLYEGNELIGGVELCYKETPSFNAQMQSMVEYFASQLELALSNILANEQLIEEKQFKETLLEISEAATQIRDREGLYQVIMTKLKPYISFEDAVLILLSENQLHYTHIDVSYPSRAKDHKHYHQVMNNTFPVDNSPVEEILGGNKVDFFEVKNWSQKYPDHPGVQMMRDIGENYTVSLLLKESSETFATVLFHFADRPEFGEAAKRLYDNISNQLAVAISNVLANEQLQEEKQFKETLLSISEAVASIQDRKELFKVIFDRIQPLAKFDDFGLFHLDKSGKYHRDLAVTDELSTLGKPIKEAKMEEYMSNHDALTIFIEEGPLVISLSEIMQRFPDYPQYKFMQKHGLKQIFGGPLVYQGKNIGMLAFNSKTENFYSEKDAPLFLAIADQLAMALSNVLANEQLLEEKQFKETLLEISEIMQTVHSGKGLILTIINHIQPLFQNYDFGLFIFNEDRTALEDYSVKYAELAVSEGNSRMHLNTISNQPLDISAGTNMHWELELLKKSGGPKIIDLSEMAELFPDYEQSKILLEVGYRHSMQTLLKNGGQTLGFFCLNALEKDFFSKSQFKLFQAIADQLAVAISNVLANEQLQTEKEFKETLLEISKAATEIRDREQLYQVVMDQIHPIVRFDDAVVVVFSEDFKLHNHLLTISPKDRKQHPYYSDLVGQYVPVAGTPIEDMVAGNDFHLLQTAEVLKKYPDNKGFNLMQDTDLNYSAVVKMFNGNAFFGLLIFHFSSLKDRDSTTEAMYLNIGNQISIALSNVLANEQVLEGKQFKEKLLEISEIIATVRNRKELFRAIYSRIREIIPFYSSGLFTINHEEDYHELISDSEVLDFPVEITGTTEKLPHKGSVVEYFSRDFGITSYKEIKAKYDHPHWSVIDQWGVEEVIYGPLTYGNEVIGFFCLWAEKLGTYSEQTIALFKNICSQLAVALSNVLANEQILEEKQFKETLLSISKAVASIQDRKELFSVIFNKIKPIFSFDEFGVFILNDEGTHHYELTDAATLEGLPAQRPIEHFFGKNALYQHEGTSVAWLMENGPVINTMRDLDSIAPHPQHKFMIEHGLKQFIGGPLKLGGSVYGMLNFTSRNEDQYSEADLSLFQAITDQLSVAVSNVLANEQLLEEKQFKETLLEITSSIAHISSGKELVTAIFDRLQSAFPFDDAGLFSIDPDKKLERDLLVDFSYEGEGINPTLFEQGLHGWMPMTRLTTHIFETGIEVLSVEELYERFDHPHFHLTKDIPFREVIVGPLRQGDQPIGILYFWSKALNRFKQEDVIIFESIAQQLSVALSNVIANEQLLDEKQFKETLLEISETATQIRDREGLYKAVMQKLKPLLLFDDAVCTVLSEDHALYTGIMTMASKERQKHKMYDQIVNQPLPLANSPAEDILKGKAIGRYTTEDWMKKYPEHPGIKLMKDTGLDFTISLKLKNGGTVFGFILFHFSQIQELQPYQERLYLNIADQISIAVSNILANERLLEEKQFKETLLEISETATQIRDREGLYKAVMQKLKPLLKFDDAVIVTISEDKESFNHVLTLASETRKQHSLYHQIVNKPLTIEGTLFEKFIASPDIYLMNIQEKLTEHPEELGLQLMTETGLNHSVVLKLKNGGELYGFLLFHFATDDFKIGFEEKLYLNIADQISIAVSNVLANEQVIEEKQFKEALLEITSSLAQITTINGLFRAVENRIKSVFHFDALDIIRSNEKFLEVLYSKGHSAENEAFFSHYIQLPGSPFEEYFTEDNDLLIAQIPEWLKRYPEYPGLQNVAGDGFQEIWLYKMYNNDRFIGCIELLYRNPPPFNERYEKLLQNLAQQIAVTVSNLTANEELRKQEKEKALQVEIVNALNATGDWKQKLLLLVRTLQRHLPFHLISFGMIEEIPATPNMGFERIGQDEYRTIDIDKFTEMASMERKEFDQYVQVFDLTEPVIANGPDFQEMAKTNPIFSGMKQWFKTENLLIYPMKLSDERIFLIGLYGKKGQWYSQTHIDLLSELQSSFTLAIEKQLAFEEIRELNINLRQEKAYLREEITNYAGFDDIIGECEAMQSVFQKIREVASLDSTVFIHGETGTGKELIARAIHENSQRKENLLVKVNCAALPPQMIESELFGHIKGAFTGAVKDRVGKFELAHKGTIFLDEIGELPMELQSKLLRVLQEKEVERLGSNKVRKLDFRLVAATNRNLQEEVQKGNFRSDLFYRLHIYPIYLPPLHQRGNDILMIAEQTAKTFAHKIGREYKGFSQSAQQKMLNYPWPGNVRELQNLVEQALISYKDGLLDVRPGGNDISITKETSSQYPNPINLLPEELDKLSMDDIKQYKEELEKSYLIAVLDRTKWRVTGPDGAARILKMNDNTLASRLMKLGIGRKKE